MVAEALKYRFNQSRRSNLYFFRDSKGNEVDLLLADEPDLFPIEIKSGMTITRDYFRGMKHFATVFPDHIPRGSGLVYSGETDQIRTDVAIFPVNQLHALWEMTD